MKKKVWIGMLATFAVLSVSLLLMVACKKRVVPVAPTGLSATVMGTYIRVSWDPASNAEFYRIEKNGSYIGETSKTYYDDNNPKEGTNYYYVYSKNSHGVSPYAEMVSCNYSGNNGGVNGGGNGGGGEEPSTILAPTGVTAEVNETRVFVTWNSVSDASYYRVYRASNSSGAYSMIESSTSNTYYYDDSPDTENYYKVTAVNNNGVESEKSSYAYCHYSTTPSITVPDAPTGVTANDNSTAEERWVLVKWNEVSNATSYNIYRSSYANGSYSQIGTTEFKAFNDKNPMVGVNYYKVKAVNSAGESDFSSYASYEVNSTIYSPCPVRYTSHIATSYQITLSWTIPTTFGCGTPTTAYLRVRNPDSGVYANLQTLSGTATTASFSYGMWADSEGYVYCGIITENSEGSSGGNPLVYNWKTNTWYGGKGQELTEAMEKEWERFSRNE